MNFGENLKKIRGEQHLSQHELAKKLEVAQSTIGMWESSKRTPKLSEISRLARVLNITVNRLLGQVRESPERKVEVIKNEIYVDGEKVSELDAADVAGIIEYISQAKRRKVGVPQAVPPSAVKTSAKKILIIDDDQEICEILYSFLIPHNYKVFLAFNGQMGLEYFEEIKPDMVLLDIEMPDIAGIEVLKIIRKVSNVPVVIITGHPQEVSEVHLADLKIEGYIEKPIKLQAVLNTLKYIIGE
jgi:CheY-like chemotaxis protein/DNA-binding XRE family transcriptional regulator